MISSGGECGAVIEEKWLVVAVDPRHEGGVSKSRDLPSKEIALSLARDWMRQGHDVIRIEGPKAPWSTDIRSRVGRRRVPTDHSAWRSSNPRRPTEDRELAARRSRKG
jgi:hypothetical protein